MDSLSVAASGIRAAIASRSFEEAGKLLDTYCQLVEKALRDAPPGHAAAAEIERRTRDLFHWSDCMVRAARANLCDRLLTLPRVSPYRTCGTSAVRHWLIDG